MQLQHLKVERNYLQHVDYHGVYLAQILEYHPSKLGDLQEDTFQFESKW